jgi:hypothetical protein
MFVSRARQTASSGTLRSHTVIGGWLLTTAAVGAFAFVAGDNAQQELDGQVITPAATISTTTQTPPLAGVVTHAKVTAAVVHATRGTGSQPAGCGRFRSAQHMTHGMPRERAVQSSNRRGPITVARAGDSTCRHATLAHVGSTPGAAQPGRASFNTPR